MEQIDFVYQMMDRYPDTFELARTAADIERIFKGRENRLFDRYGGGHSIDNSLATLADVLQAGRALHDADSQLQTAWPIRQRISRKMVV